MKRSHMNHWHGYRRDRRALIVSKAEALWLLADDPDYVRAFMDERMAFEVLMGCTCPGLYLAIDPRERNQRYTVWIYHGHGCPRLTHA